jgi:hypothetical protein
MFNNKKMSKKCLYQVMFQYFCYSPVPSLSMPSPEQKGKAEKGYDFNTGCLISGMFELNGYLNLEAAAEQM